MKTILLNSLCLLLFMNVKSQNYNLIPNSSFEFCPLNNTNDTLFSQNGCWKQISSLPFLVSQDESANSIQFARSGKKCYLFRDNTPNYQYITGLLVDSQSVTRAYLQNHLNSTLINGTTYFFTINIGFKKNTSSDFNNIFSSFTKNFGVFFSSQEINFIQSAQPYYQTPQINFTTWDLPLNDTFIYVTLKGSYIANGSEQFITIGNFDHPYQLNNYFNPYLLTSDTGIFASGSNLFVDDLSLVSDTTQPIISLDHFSLGNDTTICAGQNITLGGEPFFFHYLWNTGDTTRFVTVNSPGIYWCKVDYGCNTFTDSIIIYNDIPLLPFSLGADTSICNNQNITLTAPPNCVYNWSTNEHSQSIVVNQSNIYSCTISNACGSQSTSINIGIKQAPIQKPIINGNIDLCQIGILINTTLTTNSTFNLLWSNGSSSNTINVEKPSWYWLKEWNDCGENIDSVLVTGCIGIIDFPNAFTPNGDGNNDVFHPIIQDIYKIEHYNLKIFNRFGQQVFQSSQPNNGWDGYKSDNGTYFYLCTFKERNQVSQTLKGDFELLR